MIQKLGSSFFALTLPGKNASRVAVWTLVCVCARVQMTLFVYERKTEWALGEKDDVG